MEGQLRAARLAGSAEVRTMVEQVLGDAAFVPQGGADTNMLGLPATALVDEIGNRLDTLHDALRKVLVRDTRCSATTTYLMRCASQKVAEIETDSTPRGVDKVTATRVSTQQGQLSSGEVTAPTESFEGATHVGQFDHGAPDGGRQGSMTAKGPPMREVDFGRRDGAPKRLSTAPIGDPETERAEIDQLWTKLLTPWAGLMQLPDGTLHAIRDTATKVHRARKSIVESRDHGLGQLEVADKLVRRNRELARIKADLTFTLFQLKTRRKNLEGLLGSDRTTSTARDLVEVSRNICKPSMLNHVLIQPQEAELLEEAEAETTLELQRIAEERERNMLLLMNSFARVDELAQSVFSGAIYQIILASRAQLEAQAKNLITDEGANGPLPRIYGYNMLGESPSKRTPAPSTRGGSGQDMPPGSPVAMTASTNGVPMAQLQLGSLDQLPRRSPA